MLAEASKLFFSYARSDSEFVLRLATDLRAAGWDLWVDQLDIPKGARWDEAVEAAIKACPCLLVILSPTSANSQNVLDEVSYALEEKKTVLPILLHKCSIPFRLKRLQYLDFTADYDAAYPELLSALDGLRPPEPAPPRAEPVPPPIAERPAVAARSPGAEPATPRPLPLAAADAHRIDSAARRGISRWPLVLMVIACAVIVAGLYPLVARKGDPIDHESPPRSPDRPVPPAPREMSPPAAPAATVAPPASAPRSAAGALSDHQLRVFVERYLVAQNRADVSALLQLYDERVRYFGEQTVDQAFILDDKRNYYRRWPEVENRLTSDISIRRSSNNDAAKLSFTISFRVRSPARGDGRSGTARNDLQVRRVNGELKIVAEQQHMLSKQNL